VPIVSLYCLLVFIFTGCTLKNNPRPPEVITQQPVVVPVKEEDLLNLNLKPTEYIKEIARLQRIIVSQPERSEKAKAHFQLSSLYASYNNPQKDYQIALHHLKSYISLDPQSKQDYGVKNRLSLLNEIKELSEENAKLKQTIEELKILDQQIEKKRERYR
jgi:hypothetical protein